MSTAFFYLETLCQQRLYGSKQYVNSISMAQNNMSTGFLASKYNVNRVAMARKIMKQRFDHSKHSVISVSMGQNIMLMACRFKKNFMQTAFLLLRFKAFVSLKI